MSSSFSHAMLEKRLAAIERQLGLEPTRTTTTTTSSSTTQQQAQQPQDASSSTTATATSNVTNKEDALTTRIALLEQRWHERVSVNNNNNKASKVNAEWLESLQKLSELDPGTALTFQQQIAAPILYRRQEILAHAKSFREELQQVSKILSLLLIGQQELLSADANVLKTAQTKKDSSSTGASSSDHTTSVMIKGPSRCITESQVVHAPILVEPRVTAEQVERLSELARVALHLQERADRTTQALDRVLDQHQAMVLAISEKTVLLDAELTRRGV